MVTIRPFVSVAIAILLFQTVASQIETLLDIEDDSTYMVDESNALIPLHREKHDAGEHGVSHVELIDVTCNAKNGMSVTIEFDNVFNGIIYSQGYFSDPKCRFVNAGGNKKVYEFVVPFDGCGSKKSCSVCASVDNILVIQSDETITESWDTARRITCSQSEVTEKTIYFKPFVVDMLEVVNVPTATGGVECWMDIQVGQYPKISAIPDRIKIGETLSVLVYLKDPLREYDIIVKDCYAYDNEDYNAKSTGRLQLSDGNGCSRKRKLFGGWTKTTDGGNSGATLVVHNTLYAFKFPDKAQVYLKCDIEICRNGCDVPICEEGKLVERKVERKKVTTTTPRAKVTVASSPLSRATSRGNVIRSRPTAKVVEDVPTTQRVSRTRAPVTATAFATAEVFTEKPVTRGSTQRRTRPTIADVVTEAVTRGQRTRGPALRTKAPVAVTERVSEVSRGRPRGRVTEAPTYLPPETTTAFSCDNPVYVDDPRCVKPTTSRRVETTKFVCTPDSLDERCKPDCSSRAGRNDPRCPKPTTAATRAPPTVRNQVKDDTTRPPRTRAPNTRAPTQAQTERPTRGRTTTQASTYLPPIIVEDTTKAAKCSNGAPDSAYPDCCINAGGKGKYCCTNGANNEACELPTRPPVTRPPTTRAAPKPKCSNGAPDSAYPDCCINAGGKGKYCCTNGANNAECELPTRATRPTTTRGTTQGRRVETTTSPPTYLPPETTRAPKCSNGAPDSAYPDCCTNAGGKGKFCCTNGANNEACELPTRPPVTRPPTTRAAPTTRPTTQAPRPKCSNGAPDSAYPDCCTNAGGKGKYCCTNGANNAECELPTRPTTRVTTQAPRPKCSNGAPDSAYPDCCTNAGGKGKYCCTNGATNPQCELPTKATTTRATTRTTRPTQPQTTQGRRADPTTPKPTYLPPETTRGPKCSNGAPDSAYPDCCTNAGGKGKYCCTNGATNPQCQLPTQPPTTRATTRPTTRAAPTTRPTTQAPRPKCSNGAPDSAYPDCCTNAGGKGKYCCTNGANNAECELPTRPTTRVTTQAPRPKCSNGAPDSAYPDCCTNAGGKGKYCCTNGATNPQCELPTKATTTARPTTRAAPTTRPTTQAPRPKCSNGAPDSAYPDCCTNAGGKGKYCCTNGATNPQCELPTTTRATTRTTRPTQPQTTRATTQARRADPTTPKPTYLPPETTRIPSIRVQDNAVPKPKCSNGAPDSAYPDCCTNAGGKGKYCCTNGATNPQCQLPTQPPTTRATTRPTTRAAPTTRPTTQAPRPKCSNGAPDSAYPDCCANAGGKGKYCCTNGANNPQCQSPTQPPTTRAAPTTTRFVCAPGSTDPRCPPNCAPGSRDPRCPQPTTRATQPPTTRATTQARRADPTTPKPTYLPPETTRGPKCSNGAPDSAYPDCCTNAGGKGKYCCTNGATNPQCELPTKATTTARPTTRAAPTTTRTTVRTTQAPKPKCSNGAPDSAYPDCCTNAGGKGKYCCTNGATNPQCELPTKATTTRATTRTTRPTQPQTTQGRRADPTTPKPTYLPPETTRAPKCSNGAPDSAYPDCCTNAGGKGKYCCTNGATNPQCELPTKATTTVRTTTRATTQARRADPTTPKATYLPPETTRPQPVQTTRAQPTTTRPQPTTTRVQTTTRFSCTPGSTDPRCPPNCSTNKNDPRCPKAAPPTTTRFVCTPGSTDPRCPKPFTNPTPPPRALITTPAPSCYPGSPDPKCPQPYRPSSTKPPSTYLPPFPADAAETNRRQRQIDPALIEAINDLQNPGSPDFHTIESSLSENNEEESYEDNDLHIRRRRAVPGEKEIISITLNFKGYQFA